MIKRKSSKCRLQVIRCQHIKSKCICRDHGNTECNCQRSAPKCSLYVIRRSSVTCSILTLFLINLRQCTLHERRCASNNCDHPHPEYCSKSSDTDCRRYAYDISCSNSRCSGDHQCLKRRDCIFIIRFLHYRFAGAVKQPHLQKFRPDRKIHTSSG